MKVAWIVIALLVASNIYFFSQYSNLKVLHSQLSSMYNSCEHDLNDTKKLYLEYKDNYDVCTSSLSKCNYRYSELQVEYNRFKKSVIQKTIPYYTLLRFLDEDDTDQYEYKDPDMICTDFSELHIKRLADKGYFACETSLYFTDNSAHSIVAVNVSFYNGTYQVMYIEPQDDKILSELEPGMDYCDLVGWDCSATIYKVVNCFEHEIMKNSFEIISYTFD